MTTIRSRDLSAILSRTRAASDPGVKPALVGICAELKERLTSGSKESHDFFVAVCDSVQGLRGTAHASLRIDCLSICCQYFYLSSDPFSALGPARHSVTLAKEHGSRGECRKALNLLGIVLADSGNLAEAVECYSEALTLAQTLQDAEAEATTWLNLGIALNYMSRYQEALACFDQVAVCAPSSPVGVKVCLKAAHGRSICYFHLGEHEQAIGAVERSLAGGDDPSNSGDFYSRVVREHHYVQVLLEINEFQRARDRLPVASDFSLRANTKRASETVLLMRGLIEAQCGDVALGLQILEGLLSSASSNFTWRLDVLTALTRAYEKSGRIEKALDCLQEILYSSKRHREELALAHIAGAGSLPIHASERHDLSVLRQRQAILRTKLAEANLFQAQIEMLERLAVTADLRDEESGEHGFRVGRLASLIAEELGWSSENCLALDLAARLHDIGKVGIPDRILLANKELQATERKWMCAHAGIGAELLARSNIRQLRIAEEIARFHHERWDGSGYPEGRAGERIPVHARIVAVADVFDAMTHGRPYGEVLPFERALREIKVLAGRSFDPKIVDCFVKLVLDLRSVQPDLDSYLAGAGRASPFLQARGRIRRMLSGMVETAV